MKIRQVEYFCAVAEEKSISAAARRLHVAQPPISRQIALLEHELDVQLFVRGNKGMSLTEAGEALYQQSQQLMGSIGQIADNVRALGQGVRGSLKIGMIYSTIPYALEHIRRYHEKYPQIELFIRLGSPQELIGALNRGELNALFLRTASGEPTGLHERILGGDALSLIVTERTDPAPDQKEIPIERLRDVPMCLLRSDDLWRYDEFLIHQCQRNGFSPRVVCQCHDTPMVMQMVRAGFGVSFLPSSIVQTQPDSGIYAKNVRGLDVKSYTILAWNDAIYRSKAAQLFTAE